MKLILLISLFTIAVACQKKKREIEISETTASRLVEIVEGGELKDLTRFIKSGGYHVRDTDHMGSGINKSIIYYFEDSLGHDEISAIVENESQISNVGLYTDDKALFDKINEDLEGQGFYIDQSSFDEPLVKEGSRVEILQLMEGGPNPRYQIIFSRRGIPLWYKPNYNKK